MKIAEKASEDSPRTPLADAVAEYWDRLSANGRQVYAAAARIEGRAGESFMLDDIADELGISYDRVKSMHRTAGRTARKWREDTATEPPVDLVDTGEYGWKEERGGQRTVYRLPEGVAEIVSELAAA